MRETLTPKEADTLIKMKKRQADEMSRRFPVSGKKLEIPLIADKGKERFLLDIYRGRIGIRVDKGTYQMRGRQTIPLVRLDYGGNPHRNPDGKEIPVPHLHIYRAGYDDKWARPLSDMPEDFPDTSDSRQMFEYFLRYCKIGKILIHSKEKQGGRA